MDDVSAYVLGVSLTEEPRAGFSPPLRLIEFVVDLVADSLFDFCSGAADKLCIATFSGTEAPTTGYPAPLHGGLVILADHYGVAPRNLR
jgi:hypothetical protein